MTDPHEKARLRHAALREASRPPGLASQAASALKSSARFVSSGFKRVSNEVYNHRINICRACEFWEEDARMGYGKCKKCGCGKGKHWLPHEQCPIGKWGKTN